MPGRTTRRRSLVTWVANALSNSVVELDATTGAPPASLASPLHCLGGPHSLSLDRGDLWVACVRGAGTEFTLP